MIEIASTSRLNQYRLMWLFVFFDMPTETKQQRKAYATFRKQLLADGFRMFQFSLYVRHCPSWENAQVHIKRIERIVPHWGDIAVLSITDRQFKEISIFHGYNPRPQPDQNDRWIQLELF